MMTNGKGRFTKYVILSTFTCLCFIILQFWSIQPSSKRAPFDEHNHEKTSIPLSKPPDLKDLLPRFHIDGTHRHIPSQHDQPFVYTSSSLLGVNKQDKKLPLLYLYAQGTSVFDRYTREILKLNITSCLVNGEKHPLLYRSNGLFACYCERKLRLGDPLSLVLSPNVFAGQGDEQLLSRIRSHVRQMDTMSDGSYILPTDAFWEGQIDTPVQGNEGRYEICLMTQEKLFGDYLPEWVEYHRKLGVDQVYIYDNNAPEDLAQTLGHRSDVEIVYWPWPRSQIQAQNHFILNGRRRCKWGVLIDVDEYVMIQPLERSGEKDALKNYCRSLRQEADYSEIRLSSTSLGSSGHRIRPRMPVAEAYWHFADPQDNLTKPIVRLGHALPDSFVHGVTLPEGYYNVWKSSEYRTKAGIGMELVHMKFKAWSDFLIKAQGGRSSMAVNPWKIHPEWTLENPSQKHLENINRDSFTQFRIAWRRVMSRSSEQTKLVGYDDEERRLDLVKKEKSSKIYGHGSTTGVFINTIIE